MDNGSIVAPSDECLGVRFFWFPEENEARSKAEGRPIFEEKEMIEILIPGCRDAVHRKVNDIDKARFKNKYESFKSLSENKMSGTPLSQLPFMSAADRKELEYFNVFTAEQLVGMPDGNVDRLGLNGRSLIKKVKAYMDAAKDTAVISRMTEENDSLRKEMALMKEQMDQILKMQQDAGIDTTPRNLKKVKG